VTVIVLIARIRSTGGGTFSLQADKAKIIGTMAKIPKNGLGKSNFIISGLLKGMQIKV
jgi:hypothetical protein